MMSEVSIPFREDMTRAVLDGFKFCTSRTKCYGNPGDTFVLEGRTFLIKYVMHATLEYVANNLYGREGTASPEAFVALWNEIHPRRGFDPSQKVWVHFFEEAGS